MGRKEKLIKKLMSKPKDMTYDEIKKLLGYFGYKEFNKGKTSGSRVEFIQQDKASILLHKPHKRNTLLEYQIKELIQVLKEEGLF